MDLGLCLVMMYGIMENFNTFSLRLASKYHRMDGIIPWFTTILLERLSKEQTPSTPAFIYYQ